VYHVHCPTLGAEVSLPAPAILSMHRTASGTTGYFRCRCGATGVLTVGRLSLEPVMHHPAAPAVDRELVTAGTTTAA
jgi:hypothetical protein